MPWVAIDASTRKLYSAVWNDCCEFRVYDLDSFGELERFKLAEGSKLPPEIQGGAFFEGPVLCPNVDCFSNISLLVDAGDLYVATNENDAVWKVEMTTGEISFVLSDSYDHHDYEVRRTFCSLSLLTNFPPRTPYPHIQMEGFTFWDLRKQGMGVMHM